MKKFIFLFLTCSLELICTHFCNAQNTLAKQWDKRFGGTAEDDISTFQQTKDGGYILAGYSFSGIGGNKSQASWDTTSNNNYSGDFWIVKIDSLGNKKWDRDFGGQGSDYLYAAQQTSDGGYILGGRSTSGAGGNKTQGSWGGADYWIIKIDSLGNQQWDKDFGASGDDELNSLQQTADGGYILGGLSNSVISGDKTQASWGSWDYWILKTDSLGTKQWDKDFGGTANDGLYSIQQTADKGFILGGYSGSGIGGTKTQASWGYFDSWLIKTDSLGNQQWDKAFGGSSYDYIYSLQQTTDGGYILGGISESGISGDKTQPTWGGFDYWIVKTDALGNKQWDKDFGGDNQEQDFGNVFQTFDNGYLVAGASSSDSSGDKTENNLGIKQTWVVKTDSLGNKQWEKTLLVNGKAEKGFAIQTTDRCYAVTDYNNAPIGGEKTQNPWNNSHDYWIIKFCDSAATTGIQSTINNPKSTISIFPNPANELLVINYPLLVKEKIQITITDITGKEIFAKTFSDAKQQEEINVKDFSAGIYFIRILTQDGIVVRKFMKN